MTNEDREYRFLIIAALICAFWAGFVYSCSANYHMAKFIKKRGKIKNDTTLVRISDTIKVNGKDSIVYRDMQYICPELEAPKTRWETRIEYRYKKSKDKLVYRTLFRTKKVYIKDQKVKSKFRFKQENKNNKTLNLALIVAGLITLTILAFKFSK